MADSISHKIRKLWQAVKSYLQRLNRRLDALRVPIPDKPTPRFWLFSFLRKLGWCLVFLLIFLFLVDINFLWLFGKSPSLEQLENPTPDLASEVYTVDGKLLGKYYTENRSSVSYDKLSPQLVNALVATEDVRFYDHSGIDLRVLPSILWYTLKGDSRGGSTITQQLAKNLYKTRSGSSRGLLNYIPGINVLIIKLKEWITAVKLERRFSKEEILAMYLNTVDFGSNTFGIKTASKTFFGRSPDSLRTEQAAVLIGLLKAPTYYSPIRNPENALARRNVVLGQMAKYGYLAQQTADSLSQKPLGLNFHQDNHYDGPGTYFRGVLNNYLKAWCKKHGYDLYTDGLKIYTTIDSRMQRYAEEAVEEQMRTLQRRFNTHWKGLNPWIDADNKEIPGFIEAEVKKTHYYKYLSARFGKDTARINDMLNKPKAMTVFSWKGERDTSLSTMDSLRYYKHFLHAGFMVMDPYSGQIKAWVGGIDYKYFQYDHVMQAKRQPGSTFKPILYAAAFEKGWGPCDSLVDQPVTIHYEENGEKKAWSPHNADWIFTGQRMTLRRAMGKSINSVAAQLTEKIGWETVIEYAKKMGIKSPLQSVPSIGLGSSDVSIYELVGAYGTFMNRGIWTEPAFLTRITDRNGKVIATFRSKRHKALSEETAFLMTDMLRGGLEEAGGTSQALFSFDLFKGNELGGKTGTSSNHSDGWFVGVSKELIGGSWVGGEDRCIHFRTSALGEGSKTALPIFGLFMEKIYADKSLGIKMGYFPRPAIKIKKSYNCRTIIPKAPVDSSATDSGAVLEEGPF